MEYESIHRQNKDFKYVTFSGQKISREKLCIMMLDVIGDKKMFAHDIAAALEISAVTTHHLLRSLVLESKIFREKKHRYTLYYRKEECLLASMFYPTDIISKFKINEIKKVRVEDGRNVSYPLSINHIYTQPYTVYNGEEWTLID